MRPIMLLAALLCALLLAPIAGPAAAAPVSQPAAVTLDQQASTQNLLEEVRHRRRGYCHWHRNCGYKWRCWWRHGEYRCGWRWSCRPWCHWHRRKIVIDLY